MIKAEFIKKIRLTPNRVTIEISIPQSLARQAGVRLGDSMRWSIEGRVQSLRKVKN